MGVTALANGPVGALAAAGDGFEQAAGNAAESASAPGLGVGQMAAYMYSSGVNYDKSGLCVSGVKGLKDGFSGAMQKI